MGAEFPGTGGGGGAPSGPAGGVLSGTYPNPGAAASLATQAELDAHEADTTSVHGIANTALLETTAGSTSKANAAQAASQPLDSDLTAIAALSTTSFGRAFLALADAAAARTAIGTVIGTDVQAFSADLAIGPLQSILKWVTGRYYGSVIAGNAAHTALRMYAYPLWVPEARTIDRIGVNVTTGVGASAARCLVYAHDPTTGLPGALLFDPGADLTTTGAGAQEHTVSWLLPKGIVWLAMETNATGTFQTNQTHSISFNSQVVGHTSVSSITVGLVTSGAIAFGAGPDPFPASAASTVCPVIRVRAT